MNYDCDVAIIGAGPAGIAAACCASECGRRVIIIDDNPIAGGQIWRGGAPTRQAAQWRDRLAAARVTILSMHTVIAICGKTVRAEAEDDVSAIRFQKLILCTGSRELFLPFPGWTLPGVMGVGGIQAMVKSGLSVKGKRIIVAGSGPLLLAVAAHLRRKTGAEVLLLAEQTPMAKVLRLGASLLASPGKLAQAVKLKWQLRGIRTTFNAWPTEAVRRGRGLAVMMRIGRRSETMECDYLATGFGLVPSTEIAQLCNCACDNAGFVVVDSSQRTSSPDVLAAGEITGIGGVEKSIIEGQIAGFTAAGRTERIGRLLGAREHAYGFMRRLNDAYSLRQEVLRLADPGTVICRCEDVRLADLASQSSAREARLQTRCGMGPCQGRICGAILRASMNWRDESIRPPASPVRLASLAVPPAADI
ncbi:MAG: NAD(P)/FAD-dependent oxidoreductase [Burkholderiales bacterium]|nr:NAD(P)/FAD-dependent oxidoreductase [Phycisphaerae bacterium]